MYTALRLQRRLRPGEASVTVVEPNSYMTYQPFLPEAAAGNLEPRHVVVPLRRVLSGCTMISGAVVGISHAERTATVRTGEGDELPIGYDTIVVCPGSVARTLPIPGLAEYGIGFKSVAEAIYLRNRVIERFDAAASTPRPEARRRALTFVFIGGGYAGIEALAELEDMARDACRSYPELSPEDMRWVLVEATGRILPEVSPAMGLYTIKQLEHRGIEVKLNTRVDSLTDGHVVLDSGEEFDSETVVWTAGVKAHPMLAATDFALDDRGRLKATAFLQVDGARNAWTAGDCAAVPDLTEGEGATTGPSAQHAVRQAKRLADNILADLRGKPIEPYAHRYAGSVASLGLHKGVAEIYGVKLRGLPAWFMHRTYHLSRVPTANRKARVVADWTLALFFRREIVSLGSFADPKAGFRAVAGPEAGLAAAAGSPAAVTGTGPAPGIDGAASPPRAVGSAAAADEGSAAGPPPGSGDVPGPVTTGAAPVVTDRTR
jgi:NADH:ubiquinone reductase (H+-translocating)